jgi:hypothetical protein
MYFAPMAPAGSSLHNDKMIFVDVPIDGIFDERTTSAVRTFQANNNLDVTGKVDFKTFEKIDEYWSRAWDKDEDALRIVQLDIKCAVVELNSSLHKYCPSA